MKNAFTHNIHGQLVGNEIWRETSEKYDWTIPNQSTTTGFVEVVKEMIGEFSVSPLFLYFNRISRLRLHLWDTLQDTLEFHSI
jgi:hypothetical protein